ncbi:MAG: phospholipase [Verrucomicrobia bacterium]|nr:phospholipase [Verrucomicrobiota bacterium]
MPDLNLINTIVVVMMENRSFDHLLGYLSLPPFSWPNVDGIRDDGTWRTKASSVYQGSLYPPFLLTDPYDLMVGDPPHERDNIALQMGTPTNGVFPMNGFVTNYAGATGAPLINPGDTPPVTGYFTPDQVPVTDFFAQNFAICDHWFSSLPAGTQPNRLMAMSGFSNIAVNQFPLPDQPLVYDWLTKNKIRWRVYHEGMPFFAMMLRWIPDLLQEIHFRPLKRLWDDVQNELPDEFPQVIFVEPVYTDAPHFGPSTDDHAPSAVKGGQQFLLEVYRDMSLIPDIWKSTVMIVTYDEHGGFFDHVSPPALKTDPPPGANYTEGFETLGVRVPGLVLSPFVKPKTVFNGILDHTSVLKFIAQKFGKGVPYSNLVNQRQVVSVVDVINLDAARSDTPVVPPLIDYLKKQPLAAGYTPGTPPPSKIGEGFKQALDTIRNHPANTTGKFAELEQAFPP